MIAAFMVPQVEEKHRCCCNCKHNIRKPKKTFVECYCEIDGHYISYVGTFEGWCRRWAKDNLQLESDNANISEKGAE